MCKKWIKCEIELPKFQEKLIVLFDNGSREIVSFNDYFKEITDGYDTMGNQKYTQWYKTVGVTHWMYLPEEGDTNWNSNNTKPEDLDENIIIMDENSNITMKHIQDDEKFEILKWMYFPDHPAN